MMNSRSSKGSSRWTNAAKNVVSSGNGGGLALRFVDTARGKATTKPNEAFAPLTFTLDPSMWKNDRCVRVLPLRPTLISPPAPEDDGLLSVHRVRGAPSFPAMEDFKSERSPKRSLKRHASELVDTSFLPYKKRLSSFRMHGDIDDLSSLDSSPASVRVVDVESIANDAAAILLHMRYGSTPRSDKEGIEQDSPRSASPQSPRISISSPPRNSTCSRYTNPTTPSIQTPKANRRSVTPGPSSLRLALPDDTNELNSLHCFVRSELLELFALPLADDGDITSEGTSTPSPTGRSSQNGCSGRVGLRCVYCSHLPRRARAGSTMSTFYPKSLTDVYRSVCTWQRIHFRTCRHVPAKIRETYWQLKDNDRTRGKTRYWVSSARRLGLVDADSDRGGICFADRSTTA